MAMSDEQIERQQVEWVFGLTGGELADADEKWEYVRWDAWDDKDAFGPAPDYVSFTGCSLKWGQLEHSPAYWYEGAPEYVQRDLERTHGFFSTFRTLIVSGGGYLSAPAFALREPDGTQWALVGSYSNSGETECPMRGETVEGTVGADGEITGDCCPLCEAEAGEEHGYIYIGEGYEAVYVRIPAIGEED